MTPDKLQLIERLAATARKEQPPPIDVRAAVRRRIRDARRPVATPVVARPGSDPRPWLVLSALATAIAILVAGFAADAYRHTQSQQSLANLTNVVQVSLQ